MPVFIHDIITSNPDTFLYQSDICSLMKSSFADDRKTQSIIHKVYSRSGIEKRHTVLDSTEKNSSSFFNRLFDKDTVPYTDERNQIYKGEATKLFLDVGERLLAKNTQFNRSDITHVITVSCTGFYAPGPDFEVVRGLQLNASTQRFHVGFMGCYAAFPALKMAQSFCEADPKAKVLVISVELCSLHFQHKNDSDNIIASSVFADGAAGVLVSSENPSGKGFKLIEFASSLAYEGEKDMAWTIGNTGFNMILSSYVPNIIASNLEEVLKPLFSKLSISKEDIDIWAVHPGGRAIVDKVEESLSLSEEQVKYSRRVLAEYGNMSSVTVLFVLKEILESTTESGSLVLPMAFGPGLTIESGLLKVVS